MNHEHETRAEYRRHLEEEIDQNAHHKSRDDFDHHPPYVHHHKGGFKWVWRIVGIVCVLLFLAGGYEYHQLHSTAKGVFSTGDGKVDKKLAEGKPVSVLAMGTDVGALDRGNSGGNTDTLEVITVNPKKQSITIINSLFYKNWANRVQLKS